MLRSIGYLLTVFLLCFLLQSCQQRQPSRSALQSKDPILNKELGDLFLAKNKLKPGVVTTPSGLQYFIVRNGVGSSPHSSDLVTVFYQGQFINGTTFDKTHLQEHPVTVRISSVIPGWQQALQHMQIGSIWVIYVPPELAFGEKGIPGQIPPNQTLVYTINLVGFKKG